MKYKWNRKPEDTFSPTEGEGEVRRWGGYSSRHQYEQKKNHRKRFWKTFFQAVVLLVLLCLLLTG